MIKHELRIYWMASKYSDVDLLILALIFRCGVFWPRNVLLPPPPPPPPRLLPIQPHYLPSCPIPSYPSLLSRLILLSRPILSIFQDHHTPSSPIHSAFCSVAVPIQSLPLSFILFVFLAARRSGECSKVVEPKYCSKDLHYNQTFVLEKYQTSRTVLQDILDSQCSPELKKYLCYTTVPPCKPNDLSVYMPCRSVCEQVCFHFNFS